MRDLLSDATWARLDPYAGRLTRRQVMRGFAAAAVALVLVLAAVATLLSGLVAPRVAATGSGGFGYQQDTGVIYYAFDVTNQGAFPVELVGVGRAGPGLEPAPLPAEAATGGRLAPGEQIQLGVAYRVTDCDAVPEQSWPVPVRVARPWGTHTVWIELPPQSPDDVRPAGAHTGVPAGVEWQRNLADAACR